MFEVGLGIILAVIILTTAPLWLPLPAGPIRGLAAVVALALITGGVAYLSYGPTRPSELFGETTVEPDINGDQKLSQAEVKRLAKEFGIKRKEYGITDAEIGEWVDEMKAKYE